MSANPVTFPPGPKDRNDPTAKGDNGVGLQLHEIGGISSHQIHIVRGPTLVEFNVAAPRPSQSLQLLSQCANAGLPFGIAWGKWHQNPYAPQPGNLLCARRKRPSRRATKPCD